MKHLVIGFSSLLDSRCNLMYDEAEEFYAAGDEVFLATCAGRCRTCCMNPTASSLRCAVCRAKSAIAEHRFKGRVHIVKFKEIDRSTLPHFQYDTVKELKRAVYKGVSVGYAAFSEYVSWTRDIPERFDGAKRKYIDFLLTEACCYTEAALDLFEKIKPDSVSVFNGRFLEGRPFFELAIANKITERSVEHVLEKHEDGSHTFKKVCFVNSLPHNVDTYAKRVFDAWDNAGKTEDEKRKIASEFFIKKRKGIAVGCPLGGGGENGGVFIGMQKVGALPNNFDSKKKNIVIFNSSEDEFTSIDAEFESHALYLSQVEAVRDVAKALVDHPEYHIYLRVHPNLIKVKYAHHLNLYKLQDEFPNLTVIRADAEVSTYDLMSAADKVVVMGSTMGVEARYWKKPVILIGAALYCRLNIAYTPKNYDEMVQLLLADNLKPIDSDDVLKFGYYLSEYMALSRPSFAIDFGVHYATLRGHEFHVPNWPTFPFNKYVYKFIKSDKFMTTRFMARNPLPVPMFKN